MCDAFIKGIVDSGNEYILSDLYKMGFDPTMTEQEYLRDAYYRNTPDIASDVLAEQQKINSVDAIAFIYPVFWTEAPAKLVGWFDRVWSYGFAYGEKAMKELDKAIVLCSAGNPIERLEQFGLLDSMKKVMLGDRLFGHRWIKIHLIQIRQNILIPGINDASYKRITHMLCERII